jgi:hypothetical protein
MYVQGFDDLDSGLAGNAKTIWSCNLTKQQEQRHGDDDISFFLTHMAKPSYRGMFKDVIYNLTKGFDDWSHKTARNADSVNSSKSGRKDSNTYIG